MKSTRYTNTALNEKCMCWGFIDYVDTQFSHTLCSYVMYDPHKKKSIFTVNNTGLEAEFAFAEVNRPTKFRGLVFLVG